MLLPKDTHAHFIYAQVFGNVSHSRVQSNRNILTYFAPSKKPYLILFVYLVGKGVRFLSTAYDSELISKEYEL